MPETIELELGNDRKISKRQLKKLAKKRKFEVIIMR